MQLTELAVYVTLNSGVTPGVRDPWGHVTQFNDATQLAAYLLAAAFAEGVVTPVLISTYALTVDWLIQTGQTYLQAGEQELIATRASGGAGTPWGQAHEVLAQAYFDIAAAPAAQRGGASLTQALAYAQAAQATLAANANPYAPLYATFYETAARVYLALGTLPAGQAPDALLAAAQRFLAGGLPTNPANTVDATAIANAQADAALQNEALAPALRHAITERLVSTQSSSKTIDVTVDALGRTTVHDKDQSASPVLGIVTAVVDIAAVISGQYWALAVASALNAGQAVNDFAHGETVNGLIHAGSAVGFGYLSPLVGVNKDLAAKIFEATAVLAGTNGVAQSARSGSALGVIAGALEVTAGLAGGLISYKAFDTATLNTIHSITVGLGIAAGATAGAAAIQRGDLANGLLSGLGAVYGAIEAAKNLYEANDREASSEYNIASNSSHTVGGRRFVQEIPVPGSEFSLTTYPFVDGNFSITPDYASRLFGSPEETSVLATMLGIRDGFVQQREILWSTDSATALLPRIRGGFYTIYDVGDPASPISGARIAVPSNDPTTYFYSPYHYQPGPGVPNAWIGLKLKGTG